MKKLTPFILFVSMWTSSSYSQNFQTLNSKQQLIDLSIKNQSGFNVQSDNLHFKKPGHYSTDDWRALIDSCWGPGVSTVEKLEIFDNFWNKIDRTWGGFPNLNVNWDSLRDVYRPIIEAGVSEGRFAGILSSLTRTLQEWHAGITDLNINNTLSLFNYGDNNDEFPNYQSFNYLAGLPIINVNNMIFRTNFGAGLTLLSDSIILVYSVMPNHPLNLHPGDIILGYDGIPWKKELNELLEAELPILSNRIFATNLGSSPYSSQHAAMMSAGMNWGLFDTIDIVKYPSNDTVHYPTSLLSNIKQPYFVTTQQMPVKGVPFPDINGNRLVSWGIVEGTNIGYIYAWDWFGAPGQPSTKVLFGQAVDELIHINKVDGLILDFRTNTGGDPSYANDGFKQLFNIDPTYNYTAAIRSDSSDHFIFKLDSTNGLLGYFTPTSEVFDHPIAVLLGPNCGSAGDYNAYRLRFHPMARSFGLPANGAYVAVGGGIDEFRSSPFAWRIDDGCIFSKVNNEGYMIHKSFPVDEKVWLTREGVANGEDDVVNRALKWINNVSYAHSVTLNKTALKPNLDTVIITAVVENPNQNPLNVKAILKVDNKEVLDTINLYNDGLHHDGQVGDSIWGNFYVNKNEQTVSVSIVTEDPAGGDTICLSNAVRFTSIGPLVLDSVKNISKDQLVNPGDYLRFKFTLKNNSSNKTVSDVSSFIIPLDTCASISLSTDNIYGNIAAGTTVEGSIGQYIKFNKNSSGCNARFVMEIKSEIFTFWKDTFEIEISNPTGIIENEDIVRYFNLDQNYPNPFYSTTTISYQLPYQSNVQLKVFDIQGREVKTLVEGIEDPGNKSITFNADSWPAGIYYYRLQAGDFVQTNKLILLK